MRRVPSPDATELPRLHVAPTRIKSDQIDPDVPRQTRMDGGGGETWREDWRVDAACVGEDLEMFFPLGDQATHHALSNQAKQVCARCPVMTTCRAWALQTSPEFGIFGGLTAHERRLVREGRWNGSGPRRRTRDTSAA